MPSRASASPVLFSGGEAARRHVNGWEHNLSFKDWNFGYVEIKHKYRMKVNKIEIQKICRYTLQGNWSHIGTLPFGTFESMIFLIFLFPVVGYVSFCSGYPKKQEFCWHLPKNMKSRTKWCDQETSKSWVFFCRRLVWVFPKIAAPPNHPF